MGMFDSFYFTDGVLPDNKAPSGHEFQTKDLACHLDKYSVAADGAVTVVCFYDGEPKKPLNFGAKVYSHEFMYDNEKDLFKRKYIGAKYQEYKIVVVNDKLAHIEKVVEAGYEPVASAVTSGGDDNG